MFLLRKLPLTSRRILVARTDYIGDFVSTLPMFQTLGESGYADVSALCRKENAALIAGNPYIKEALPVNADDPWQILKSIRSRQFDTLIVAVNDNLMLRLLPKLGFIPRRVGPLSPLRCLLYYNYPVIQKRSRSVTNEASYNLDLLRPLGIAPSGRKPKIYLTDEEKNEARQEWKTFCGEGKHRHAGVILHQGMRGSALNLRPEYYPRLTRLLIERGMFVGLTGNSDTERTANRKIIQSVPASQQHLVQDLAGVYRLRRLCALISQADALIAPSTGPLHIANAVGTKFVGIFSPIRVQTAKRWAPFQRDPRGSVILQPDERLCGQETKCLGEKCKQYYCLDDYTPEKICDAVESLIFGK